MKRKQRLERIRERAEGLGLIIFDGCGEEFKICQGHVKHIFPIRDSSLIPSYHGEPDKGGTEFSIQEAERLLSALERKPGVRVWKLMGMIPEGTVLTMKEEYQEPPPGHHYELVLVPDEVQG